MKKTILFTLLCLFFEISYSQTRGVVLDFETSERIPYVNISIKGTDFGTTSNENGEFIINENTKNRLLVVSSIGYENALIELTGNEMEVFLKPKIYEIREVFIKPNKERRERTINSLKKKRSNHIFGTGGKAWIVAKYFKYKTEYYETPYISKIGILTDSDINNAMFNVRLLSCNENGEPCEEIYQENLISYAKKGKKAVKINISDENIEFPENGLFIALEWFIIENNKFEFTYTMEESKKKYKGIRYAPGFSTFKTQGESDTWVYIGGKWNKITDTKFTIRDLAVELTLTN